MAPSHDPCVSKDLPPKIHHHVPPKKKYKSRRRQTCKYRLQVKGSNRWGCGQGKGYQNDIFPGARAKCRIPLLSWAWKF